MNTEWIEAKKQKTYQIAITQEYGEVATAHLDDGTDAIPRIVSQFFIITLFHPTRTGVWTLYRNITKVFNDRSLTTNGVNGNTQTIGGVDWPVLTKQRRLTASIGHMGSIRMQATAWVSEWICQSNSDGMSDSFSDIFI